MTLSPRFKFALKFLLSIALALISALFISYDLVSFALVFLIAAYAFCPVRSIKPHARRTP